MKKVLSIVSAIIAGLLVIGVIAMMISATISISRGQPVYMFNYALGVVPTDSMVGSNEDSLDVNDMYVMTSVGIDDIEIGDVIVYQGVTSNGQDVLIVHRVVGEDANGFITQGDNETQTDQAGIQDYITDENLVGRYVFKITFLKPISSLIQSSRSLIFLILIIVILLILIFEIKDIIKMIGDKQKNDLELKKQEELNALKEEMKKDILKEIDKK